MEGRAAMRHFDRQPGELILGPGAECCHDAVARQQYGPHQAGSSTTHIACNQTMVGCQQAGDGPMFAMGAQGADESGGDERWHQSALATHPPAILSAYLVEYWPGSALKLSRA